MPSGLWLFGLNHVAHAIDFQLAIRVQPLEVSHRRLCSDGLFQFAGEVQDFLDGGGLLGEDLSKEP